MMQSEDPADIDHPQLREFAIQAVWVAKLEEAVDVLEDLVMEPEGEEPVSEAEREEDHPLEVALAWWRRPSKTLTESSRRASLSGWPKIPNTGQSFV